MNHIRVNSDKCNACKKCIKYCNYDAISIIEGKAVIDLEKCTLCRACIDKCKFSAIEFIEGDKKIDLSKYKGIWVIVEHFDEELKNTSFQLISKAVELSKKSKDKITALLIGNKSLSSNKLAKIFSEFGVDKVISIVNSNLSRFNIEEFSEIISDEILKSRPKIVLFLGTIFGRSIAPRVATRVKTGLTADCTELDIDDDGFLVQIRPTYGGKVLAKIITPYSCPQMASVRPNVFVEQKYSGIAKNIDVSVLNIGKIPKFSTNNLKTLIKTIKKQDGGDTPLEEARIIFCAGFGVGSKEGYEVVKRFAEENGAIVAASRAVVDLGWADFSKQIGQTGTTVRPEIYVGFGVSGAIHHLMGMKNSRKIIAINKDPRAPIFKIADYCIIADLFEFIDKYRSS